MFVYSMAKAVNRGYISRDYVPSILKGYRGIVDDLIEVDDNGLVSLTQCCSVAGLGYGRDGSYEYYLREPIVDNDHKGVGSFILAGIEVQRLLGLPMSVSAENKTDVSLMWKDKPEQVSEISSKSGDLYEKVAHHGPAVENEWMGVRIYFDKKCALDIYNKTRPGLELAAASWYPTPEQQQEGWGADQYKVGPTVGLGGVRLWDGEKVVVLDPVTMRTARAKKEACYSQIEMLSEGVPYKGRKVDVLIRVTAYSGCREMKVEAFALCDEPVQFATGVQLLGHHRDLRGEELHRDLGHSSRRRGGVPAQDRRGDVLQSGRLREEGEDRQRDPADFEADEDAVDVGNQRRWEGEGFPVCSDFEKYVKGVRL